MKTQELLKLFKKYGIQFVEHRSRHDKYYSPITGKFFSVPRHKAEIPAGTVSSILNDAGLK